MYGTVTSSSGLQVGNAKVKITNTRTNETLITTTNYKGDWVEDAANFASGYVLGDTVRVEMSSAYPEYDDNIDISKGTIQLK